MWEAMKETRSTHTLNYVDIKFHPHERRRNSEAIDMVVVDIDQEFCQDQIPFIGRWRNSEVIDMVVVMIITYLIMDHEFWWDQVLTKGKMKKFKKNKFTRDGHNHGLHRHRIHHGPSSIHYRHQAKPTLEAANHRRNDWRSGEAMLQWAMRSWHGNASNYKNELTHQSKP
jgi:hypothetical protein